MTARKATAKDEETPEEAPPKEKAIGEETPTPEEEEIVTLITPTEVQEGQPPADAAWEDPNTYPDPESPLRSP